MNFWFFFINNCSFFCNSNNLYDSYHKYNIANNTIPNVKKLIFFNFEVKLSLDVEKLLMKYIFGSIWLNSQLRAKLGALELQCRFAQRILCSSISKFGAFWVFQQTCWKWSGGIGCCCQEPRGKRGPADANSRKSFFY